MEPLTFGTIGIFIGKLLVGERIKKLTNPIFEKDKNSFTNKLTDIIYSTIDHYIKENSVPDSNNKYGFYKSQKIIDLLLKYRYYDNHDINSSYISNELNKDNRLFETTPEQINLFLTYFNSIVEHDEVLYHLEIENEYKQKVFDIYTKLDKVIELLKNNSETQNKISIDGNNNYVFQDVDNSKIIIAPENLSKLQADINILSKQIDLSSENNLNTLTEHLDNIEQKQKQYFNSILNELKPSLQELIEISKKHSKDILNIIILSSSSNKTIDGTTINTNEIHSKSWKPFGNDTSIDELLNTYSEKAYLKINKLYIEDLDLFSVQNKQDILDDILGEKENFIIIIDSNTLLVDDYDDIVSIFNNSAIGGCIIPIAKNEVNELIIEKVKIKLNQLYTHFFKHFHKEYIQIELFVPTKEKLYRRLSNIAISKLGRIPNKKSKLSTELESNFGQLSNL